jgi:transposase
MLGQHREEIIRRLWDGIQDSFELPDTDVNIDGSAVTVYGARSELSEHGYPRDKNPGKEQVEFMVAELQTSRRCTFFRFLAARPIPHSIGRRFPTSSR